MNKTQNNTRTFEVSINNWENKKVVLYRGTCENTALKYSFAFDGAPTVFAGADAVHSYQKCSDFEIDGDFVWVPSTAEPRMTTVS